MYTDASMKQLGSVVTQSNMPLAFFSRKLSAQQQKYSVNKIELLAIVDFSHVANCTNIYEATSGAGIGMGHAWQGITVPELVRWTGVPICNEAGNYLFQVGLIGSMI
jgi:hypothetical protein